MSNRVGLLPRVALVLWLLDCTVLREELVALPKLCRRERGKPCLRPWLLVKYPKGEPLQKTESPFLLPIQGFYLCFSLKKGAFLSKQKG